MLTRQDYETALRVVDEYRKQFNQSITKGKEVLSWAEYQELFETKHRTQLTCDDVVWFATRETSSSFDNEDKEFEEVVCTAYCGRDEFWGRNNKGEERYWSDNCNYKIVGKKVSIEVGDPFEVEA